MTVLNTCFITLIIKIKGRSKDMTSKKSKYKTSKRELEKAFSENFIKAVEEAIEKSKDAWKNPCLFPQGWNQGPYNYTSGKSYRGINSMYLNIMKVIRGYEFGAWLTFAQVRKIAEKTGLNIHVKKGEKSTEVIFWKKWQKVYVVKKEEDDMEDDEDDDELEDVDTLSFSRVSWFLKSYRVFNVAQVEWDGYDYTKDLKAEGTLPVDEDALKDIDSAQEFLTKNYKGGAPVVSYGDDTTNCYSPMVDRICMCQKATFRSVEVFFSTLAHELGHSTGASGRLNRKQSGRFGSDPYAKEELVAETTALMCCASVGILSTYDNSIAYLKSWLGHVKENSDSIVWAFKEAQKATSWILGIEK